MDLTERRKQFLNQILNFYERTRLPVHYAAIADLLGVSKWTAYSMFKELEKLGYLRRDYAVHTGEPGRSQVVFTPTRLTQDLFRQATADLAEDEEWARVRKQVLRVLARLKERDFAEVLQDVLRDMPKIEARMAFCAHLLAVFLIFLRRGVGKSAQVLIERTARQAPNSQTGLALFVGLVTGGGLSSAPIGLGLEVVDLIGRFLSDLATLSSEQSTRLFDFLKDALEQTI
ncbi:MAG: LexA family protein [Bacillota bacterium]